MAKPMPRKAAPSAASQGAALAGVDPAGAAAPLSYHVISPLRHDGERYSVGDLVELDAADAARLLALRVVTGAAVEG